MDFSMAHPGKYEVAIDTSEPLQIVLSESYYPGWIAKVDGQTIPSERIYGFFNGWYIEKTGEYEVTLEFTPSTQRKAGRIISLFTLVGIVLFFVGWWIRRQFISRSIINESNGDVANIQREGEHREHCQ